MTRACRLVLLLVLAALLPSMAQAATPTLRAFLDRSQVSLGDTVTLNIQSDAAIPDPDLGALGRDFRVLGSSRSLSVNVIDGKTTRTSRLGIALAPLRAGTLTIPPLAVGGAHTQALTLVVAPAPAGGTGKVGDPAFVEVHVSASAPYVGEQVVYTARLFYLPGVDGAWGDPAAAGARIVKLDQDHRYVASRDGYSYQVIERSWAVIPEHAGAVTINGPDFQGQRLAGVGGLLLDPNRALVNPALNGQMPGFGAPVRATAPQVALNVRAPPANAGTPWLPARALGLQLSGLPADGKVQAGVPLTLTLTVDATGQGAEALPEPRLPPLSGAEVYPDQTQSTTDASKAWLHGRRTRSFAIVPTRDGTLTLPAITLDWWNVVADRAEQASVPAHALHVVGAIAPIPTAAHASASPQLARVAAASAVVQAPAGAVATWRWLALALLAAWVATVLGFAACAWRRRVPKAVAVVADGVAHAAAEPKADADALGERTLAAARAGDAAACERALLAWARAEHPDFADVATLRDALADPAQGDALTALQRARWRGGDAAQACATVATAFARGFAWCNASVDAGRAAARLPPLYPQ